jgi:hexosaminidase
MLAKTMQNPLGLFKPVNFLTGPNFKYHANGYKTLTDGLRGDEDHHFNWLGFEGSDMEVVVDLQKLTPIKRVSADFLQINLSWIFLPKQVEVSFSTDGVNYGKTIIIENKEPLTREDTFIKKFSTDVPFFDARYVKVKAVSIKDCPRWHTGYPFPAWIFTDEIVIE